MPPAPPLSRRLAVELVLMGLLLASAATLGADARADSSQLLATVYFDFGRTEPRAGEDAKIDEASDRAKEPRNRGLEILVRGHTDGVGPDEVNFAISERRAEEVRNRLVARGVERGRIRVVGMGAAKPAVPGHDPSARRRNRRVEIVFQHQIEATPGESEEPPLVWNLWADSIEPGGRREPRFAPAKKLSANSHYVVSVHLAGLRYETAGVETATAQEPLSRFLQGTARKIELTPVLLTDPRHFATASVTLEPIEVNLERARSYLAARPPRPADVMEALRASDPDFKFAELHFPLETTAETGWGGIALSFWHGDRPVDEISASFCVAHADEPCPPRPPGAVDLRGGGIFDAAVAASGTELDPEPDASIHVLELPGTGVVGVLWTRDAAASGVGAYDTWLINGDPNQFETGLRRAQDLFGRVAGNRIGIGQDLARLLFPPDEAAGKALARLQAFSALPGERVEPTPGAARRVLFHRMVVGRLGVPALFPMELVNIGEDARGFLGYAYQIRTPLPRQLHGKPARCAAHWVPVFPPQLQDPQLADARRKIVEMIEDAPARMRLTSRGSFQDAYSDMTSFRGWVSRREDEPHPSVLAVISHHARDTLYFVEEQDVIQSHTARRRFREPSVAVLAGCSTGAAGASAILERLNEMGVHAAVATNTGISGALAGDFFMCLSEQLESQPAGAGIEIGTAFAGVQGCLFRKGYGEQLLAFSLLGNPRLEICEPPSASGDEHDDD